MKNMVSKKDVIIIGAGASGLTCAAECGKRGRSVLVLDHGVRTAAKVRISGGGRCNFTNLNATADHYYSRNPHFCKSALARFTPRDALTLAERHRIPYYEKEDGQIFCVRSSREIIAMLERECVQGKVETIVNVRVENIRKDERFIIGTDRGAFASDSLVIATGGLSYPNIGASGFGHDIARQFGLAVVPVRPALVPFVFQDRERRLFRDLAGVSLHAGITVNGKTFRGNILFTHRGLSGPAALQASLYRTTGTPLVINLMPGQDLMQLFESRRRSRVELRNLLACHLPKRFVRTWCDGMQSSKPMDQISDRELRAIAGGLHAWTVLPKGTEGYGTAEVTAGGVDTGRISSKTMEAKDVKGLYFIGEVLDVTGELGGYNLHWAWASGFAAGQFA